MELIPKYKVSNNKKVTNANMVCTIQPKKDDLYRLILTVGGDKLDYYGDILPPAASLIGAKQLINNVISDAKKGAIFLTLDIKDQFLQSLLPESEYM